jgi:hypothetical protein
MRDVNPITTAWWNHLSLNALIPSKLLHRKQRNENRNVSTIAHAHKRKWFITNSFFLLSQSGIFYLINPFGHSFSHGYIFMRIVCCIDICYCAMHDWNEWSIIKKLRVFSFSLDNRIIWVIYHFNHEKPLKRK